MTTAVREKPILFSGPMVRAILDGRKTQTRRIVKHHLPTGLCDVRVMEEGPQIYGAGGVWLSLKCPFGEVGDRLWVRETWRGCDECEMKVMVNYQADDTVNDFWTVDSPAIARNMNLLDWKWKPSIHMPRWASRITLEVTGVRVERLNEISEADAEAEGIQSQNFTGWGDEPGLPHFPEPTVYRDYSSNHRLGCDWLESPVESFRTLWDSINGKSHPWASNPWVWVVEFRRVEEAK